MNIIYCLLFQQFMMIWFRPYLDSLMFSPTFFNLSLNFAVRVSWSEPVSSWSSFCWPYRAPQSSAAKNIINLISVLTIWWCPCVELSLGLLEEDVCCNQPVLFDKTLLALALIHFCTPKANLPVILDISWIPAFTFQSPVMKRTSFFSVRSCRCCSSS